MIRLLVVLLSSFIVLIAFGILFSFWWSMRSKIMQLKKENDKLNEELEHSRKYLKEQNSRLENLEDIVLSKDYSLKKRLDELNHRSD